MKIGLFYGSSTCYTEMVAEKIRDTIGEQQVTLHDLKADPVTLMTQYDILILGIPTWDFGELQEEWEAVWNDIPALNLRGKIVALYGMGDQVGYSEWFLDALGMLYELLLPAGVTFIGRWPLAEYNFISQKAVAPDGRHFVGLALDEVNQYEISDQRILLWCEQLLSEISSLL